FFHWLIPFSAFAKIARNILARGNQTASTGGFRDGQSPVFLHEGTVPVIFESQLWGHIHHPLPKGALCWPYVLESGGFVRFLAATVDRQILEIAPTPSIQYRHTCPLCSP